VAGSFYGVLYTIYLIQDLHLNPFLLGVVVSAGGVGSLAGSFVASRIIARLGFGPALIWTATGASIVGVLTPLAGGPPPARDHDGVRPSADRRRALQTVRGHRRAVAHPGRHPGPYPSAASTPPLTSSPTGVAYPIGALMAAAIAGWIGVRGAIAIGWAGMAVSILLLVFSPLPRIRDSSDVPAVEDG